MVVKRVELAGRSLLLWGVGLILGAHCLAASAQASEAGLRVAFVYNFLKFIEWPAWESDNFSLCALGAQDATRQSLQQLASRPYQHKGIQVTYIDEAEDVVSRINTCQMLYVPVTGADMPLPQPFPSGVLLVMDEADANDTRVGIALMRTSDNRIEFVINDRAIQHAGVKVSSQLLKLAKKRRRSGG